MVGDIVSEKAPERPKKPRDAGAKRELILNAAQSLFEEQGFEGASMRAIAKKAGYTAGAIYFHFQSREDIYGALLERSLVRLGECVDNAQDDEVDPGQQMRATAQAFFSFYAEHPRALDLGFYLFRGGMRPQGLGPKWDQALNKKLLDALSPIRAALIEMGCSGDAAEMELAALFAHISGVLLLAHTGRLRLFAPDHQDLMDAYFYDLEHRVTRAVAFAEWQSGN